MRCRWLGAVNRDYYIQDRTTNTTSSPPSAPASPPARLPARPPSYYLSSRFTYSTNSSLIRRFPTECCLFKLTNCLLILCSCGTVTHLAGSSRTYLRPSVRQRPATLPLTSTHTKHTVSHSPTGSTPPAAPPALL